MKYKIIKGLIEKSDFSVQYEPKAFTEVTDGLKKKITEALAQKKIYEAKADNVLRNHPYVAKVEEEKRNAIWLFHENFVAGKQSDVIIKKLRKDLKDIEKEMKEIETQTGIKF